MNLSAAVTSPHKPSLRSEYLLRRRQAPAGANAAVTRHVLAALPVEPCILAGYAATHGEAPVWDILAAATAQNIITALPCTQTVGQPLLFRRWREGEPLISGAHDIKEPLPEATPVAPDLLLVPLIAFDRHGFRLGYGGGYYDRTLAILRRQNPNVRAWGIAYAVQEAPDLPHEPHDVPLDAIITEHGPLWLRTQG